MVTKVVILKILGKWYTQKSRLNVIFYKTRLKNNDLGQLGTDGRMVLKGVFLSSCI
jgi:hypothetical protein